MFRSAEAQGRALPKLSASSVCLGHLNTLGSTAQTFAYDHADHLPQTWSDFTNRIADPGVRYCPADLWHAAQTNWAQVDLAAISYEIVAPGADSGAGSQAYARCTIHGNSVRTHGVRVAARPYDERGFPAASSNRICLPAPALLAAKESAVSLQCLNNLKELGLAGRSRCPAWPRRTRRAGMRCRPCRSIGSRCGSAVTPHPAGDRVRGCKGPCLYVPCVLCG